MLMATQYPCYHDNTTMPIKGNKDIMKINSLSSIDSSRVPSNLFLSLGASKSAVLIRLILFLTRSATLLSLPLIWDVLLVLGKLLLNLLSGTFYSF